MRGRRRLAMNVSGKRESTRSVAMLKPPTKFETTRTGFGPMHFAPAAEGPVGSQTAERGMHCRIETRQEPRVTKARMEKRM